MDTKDILYNLRAKKGLSQDELAEKVFVTRQAVSRWENGETTPNVETLKLLSEFYDVSINTLLGYAFGRTQKADLSVLRNAAGGFHPQPGNRRLFQRGILQVVLRGRGIYLFQQGTADRFLRKAHGKRKLAGAEGSRPYGSAGSYIESLEIIAERKVSARHRQAETFCMPFESNRFTVFLRRGSRSGRRSGCRRRPAGSARWPAPTGLVHLR